MTQNDRFSSDPDSTLRIRPATAADRLHLIPLINSAFAIETFFEGTRTDEERLAAVMAAWSAPASASAPTSMSPLTPEKASR